MRQEEMLLFELLVEVNRRPEPFGEYTARELWTAPHTSERMLAYHLDETGDAASRNSKFLDRSTDWIVSHFGLTPGARVADFGCGPGLYTQRLARAGLDVTGIDFSDNSLRYARETASCEGLDIDYVHADYLDFWTDQRFDLIMMIMCDFCALSVVQRAVLLRKFRSLLAGGGMMLLDVYSPRMFDEREETATYAPDLMDGFWSPQEYFGFLNTFKYDDERLVLDKYTIVERDRTRRIYNWFQCFTPQDLASECADCGLEVVEYWSDVAGAPYDPKASEFAIGAKATENEAGAG
jgi:SAM-dependent methyltransferase